MKRLKFTDVFMTILIILSALRWSSIYDYMIAGCFLLYAVIRAISVLRG